MTFQLLEGPKQEEDGADAPAPVPNNGPLEPDAQLPTRFIPPFLREVPLQKPTFSDVFVVDADVPFVDFVKSLSAGGLTIINHKSHLVITNRPRAWLR